MIYDVLLLMMEFGVLFAMAAVMAILKKIPIAQENLCCCVRRVGQKVKAKIRCHSFEDTTVSQTSTYPECYF